MSGDAGPTRFVVLDSWRGLAACMVALFHVRVHSHVADLDLVRNAYLFVDFFFVLSGFVIAATYAERLANGFGLWRFMVLRFGRVYPLHLAMLVAFVLAGASELSTSEQSGAFVAHAFLLHGLGAITVPVWGNVPSWSISTEFFVYLIFAAAVSTFRARVRWVLVPAVVLLPLVIYAAKGGLAESDGYQLARGVYGFAAGMIAWHVFGVLRGEVQPGTGAELGAIAALIAFVSLAGDGAASIAAPIVFAAVVLVFAFGTGRASRLLMRKPFVVLGLLSYSVYMLHYFVARQMVGAVALANSIGIPGAAYLGVEKWAGDLAILMYLAVVIGLAPLTFRFIEAPARARFKQFVLPAGSA
jgi:peptidoglycan/LPS O-acetylase OafA/YrhL